MIFLKPGETFVRDQSPRTPEEQLKYVMALPHIEDAACWCFPEETISDPYEEIFVHHYPH